MRRRLYFVLPSVDSAREVVKELLLARIEYRHIHCLVEEGRELPNDLPHAGVLQRSDYLNAAAQGLLVGAAIGALVGVGIAWLFAGIPAVGALVVGAIFGALFGIWASGMIGTSVRNRRLRMFDDDLAQGKVLLMADVRPHRVEEVASVVQEHHPEAGDGRVDPTIPAFP